MRKEKKRGKHYCGHPMSRRRVPDLPPKPVTLLESLCVRAEQTGDWKPVIQRQMELIGIGADQR